MTCTSSGSDGVCARCGGPGDICCANSTCGDGCCVDGRCLASSFCVGPVDAGGQTDAPIGGAGGGGAGGAGAGGAGGTGGVTTSVQTGGAGGTTTPWTAPAACGDGKVVTPERCDDGNNLPFDGCSSDCQWEPDCSGGACTSKCGDGLVVGEDCDDGNTKDGDGCSSSCKVEEGFACAQPPLGDRILVPVIYRDFKFHSPTDFEPGVTGSEKAATGMVDLNLDAEGKPVYTNLPEPRSSVHVQSPTTFATWYRNADQVNHATPSMLTLWDNGNGAYVNRYGANGEQWPVTELAYFCGLEGEEVLDELGNPIPCTSKYYAGTSSKTDCDELAAKGYERLKCYLDGRIYKATYIAKRVDGTPLFFPIDGDSFSASDKLPAKIPSTPADMYDATGTWPEEGAVTGNDVTHNFSFTSEIRYWFKYEADKSYTLDIIGDDDVWVFVNKKLAVDLGGIHTPVPGSVTLDSSTAGGYGLEPGNVYEVAVFQAERQSNSSTFKITLAGFNLAPSECRPK
jgi:fibro-slime domain-containing protein